MHIRVRVKPNSRVESVEPLGDGTYLVRANAPASDGKANKRVQELLSYHFNCPKTHVVLLKGANSSMKTFDVPIKN